MRRKHRSLAGLILMVFSLALALSLAMPAQAGRYKEASKKHKADCNRWCKGKPECGKCLPLLPCPPGTKKLKSWKGYGKNWHACSKPGHRKRVSKDKLKECKKWCSEHEGCGKCLPTAICPPGTKKLKSWKGYGKNWYACSKPGYRKKVSKDKLKECKKWCSEHEGCGKCLPTAVCPPGTKKLKSWKGYGKNWYACSKPGYRKKVSKEKLVKCKKWCKDNPKCGKCLPLVPCPPGTRRLKSWKGYGKNWHACSKPGL